MHAARVAAVLAGLWFLAGIRVPFTPPASSGILDKVEKASTEGTHVPTFARAWYAASIDDFHLLPTNAVLGELTRRAEFAVKQEQRDAWVTQVDILRTTLVDIDGHLYLEFNIPRMGRRVDAIVVSGAALFVIEFKVGADEELRADVEQVWDYALDLKNFHEGSHDVAIIPVLVPTELAVREANEFRADDDGVFRPLVTHPDGLREIIQRGIATVIGSAIDAGAWSSGAYRPTPTIIEAARALYAQHSVEAIARFDAGADNLRLTSRRIDELIDEAVTHRKKVICFVTGVPGAGKTLVGLNVATERRERDEPTHAVFLSGNGPLVAVLREALARDDLDKQRKQNKKARIGQIRESLKAFIQNVHHFRDEGLNDPKPPFEHVVIFDEAQRAWNLSMTASFMKRKKGRPDFKQSEPEFLISCMDRHSDWAFIICLVGGGQEINRGEAGIDAWLDAIHHQFPDWHTYISSKLTDSEYRAKGGVERLATRANSHLDNALHLAVSMRSFRAENVSAFVKALLDCDRAEANRQFGALRGRYPIAVCRDVQRAKAWVRSHARGSERFGVVASSKAQRLKPHAIDVRINIDPVKWFLNDRDDTRSSFYLEDPATEFQVQGLELDWTCVTWDGDLRFVGKRWAHHDFRGTKWVNVRKPEDQNYLKNAYRVLLTRARQGMVIFVPRGDPDDATRHPDYYDRTFDYLTSLGLPAID